MKQCDGDYIHPLTKRNNYCSNYNSCRFSMSVANCAENRRESAVQQGYSVSFQQHGREQELALHLPVNLYLQNLTSDTILDYDLVQIAIRIGLGFPHTDLYRGLDLLDPILNICILYNSMLFSEEVCRKSNLNAVNSLCCVCVKICAYDKSKSRSSLRKKRIMHKHNFFFLKILYLYCCKLLYRIF